MQEFCKVIEDLILLFHELTSIANVKLNGARAGQVSAIEECITKEQSLIMKLKGLEKARETKQEELGFGGLRFKEILEKVPDSQRQELSDLFDRFSKEIQGFQAINEDVNRIINVNLHQLNKEIQKKQGQIYEANGFGSNQDKSITDLSV